MGWFEIPVDHPVLMQNIHSGGNAVNRNQFPSRVPVGRGFALPLLVDEVLQ
jgi:hypothetical protein